MTARSQVIGPMAMGVDSALMEELAVDTCLGFFVNHDLAGCEVPMHADILHQPVIFLDEVDPMASPMKTKGVRVHNYPVTVDKLLAGLALRKSHV